MKLGPFEIDHPFILAPMAGITNSPYRRLMRRRGSALVVSELISANGMEYNSKKSAELLEFEEDERIIGIQIFGERPDLLNKACQHIEKLGADFVDLNLGCPVRKVVAKGAGSAMCRRPAYLREVLEGMVRSTNLPITIKIRTGWDAESINALEVIQAAYDAGVKWVAVHGRTRAQAYEGDADWELIGSLKAKSPLPIIGNGDCNTPEKAVARYKTYGVDGVMIGRGALRNPFIFEQARDLLLHSSYAELSYEAYEQMLLDQKSLLLESRNERTALLQSKKFTAWYTAGYPHSHQFRKQVFEIKEFEQVWATAFEFFEQYVKDRDHAFLNQDFLMGGHG